MRYKFKGNLSLRFEKLINGERGFDGFEETSVGVDAYLVDNKWKTNLLSNLRILSNSNFEIEYSSKIIYPKNWNKKWESEFHPILIGDDFV